MSIGSVSTVPGHENLHYVDTGMYDVAEYGSVYLLTGAEPALIDTGIGADLSRIEAAMESLDIATSDLEWIVLTHVHLDHAGSAGRLIDRCPNATVLVHERGAEHLVDPERLVAGTKRAVGEMWTHYRRPKPIPNPRIQPVTDGDEVSLGDRTLEVIATPGHAPHHVSYYDDHASVCFPGDASGIFCPSLSTVFETSPPPNFDLEQCLDDVDRLQEVAPETLAFAHFGPANGEWLSRYRSILRAWITAVESVFESYQSAEDTRAYFADLAVGRRPETPDIPDVIRNRPATAPVWGEEKARAEARLNVDGALRYLQQ